MAFSLRIDDVVRDASTGLITFQYTNGQTPLPAGWGGSGLSFGTAAQTVDALQDADSGMLQDLAGLLLIFILRTMRRANPDLTGAQFRNAVRGLTITLNIAAATRTAAITVA